jgi:hypothetical protein
MRTTSPCFAFVFTLDVMPRAAFVRPKHPIMRTSSLKKLRRVQSNVRLSSVGEHAVEARPSSFRKAMPTINPLKFAT